MTTFDDFMHKIGLSDEQFKSIRKDLLSSPNFALLPDEDEDEETVDQAAR